MRLIASTMVAFAALNLAGCATAAAAGPEPRLEIAKETAMEHLAPLDQRIQQIDGVLKRKVAFEEYFAPAFLTAVPAEQLNGLLDSIIAQHGQPLYLVSDTPRGKTGATIQYAFERAIATIELDIVAAKPNQVIGLLITGFAASNDSPARIESEIKALPGNSAFLVADLDDAGNADIIAAHNAEAQFAIGSTFKLYILAELANQVKSGERKWSDVAPLAHRSFSSAATRGWPKDSPATLHTLAGWMLSVSDNSATDTLLFTLGREAVERRLASIGHSAPDKTLPFLSTVEAFALKANPPLRERFLKATEAAQRDLLDSQASALTLDKIDNETLSKGPTAIDTIEWFASPTDLLWLMSHLKAQKNDEALAIMGINPGLSPAAAKKWRYVGYKGGSEPGVISMTFLLQSPSGQWKVVTGSWNNAAAEVDNAKFAALMERLVAAVGE
ncbi:MAG: serine hydrolase [Sphingorhabdus sp.]